MKIIQTQINLADLKKMAERSFGNLVKAVVDMEKAVMAIDGELHADEEALLLENGSKQENLWGINLYPDLSGKELIEFDSVINLRPSSGNRTRNVDDPVIRKKIYQIVGKLIKK